MEHQETTKEKTKSRKKLYIIIASVAAFVVALTVVLVLILRPNENNLLMTGVGTYDDPYVLRTGEHLKKISEDMDAYYELGNDIDLGGQIWTPIFDFVNQKDFSGNFDGKAHTISNFILEDNNDITIGIFSGIEKSGIVKNVVIDPVVSTMRFESQEIILGFLCGINLGTIENVKVEGDVSIYCSSRVESVFVIGTLAGVNQGKILASKSFCNIGVSGDNIIVGGIVGKNDSNATIEMVESVGDVNGIGGAYADIPAYVGGVAGDNKGTIKYACNAGVVYGRYAAYVGGIAGSNSYGRISYSFNTGNVGNQYNTSYKPMVGGLVGWQSNGGSITRCYNSGVVYASGAYCGGIVAGSYQSSISNTYWLYSSSGLAVDGEYSGASGCIKCTTFNSLHNNSTLSVLNAGLSTPVFEINSSFGIIFAWQN